MAFFLHSDSHVDMLKHGSVHYTMTQLQAEKCLAQVIEAGFCEW